MEHNVPQTRAASRQMQRLPPSLARHVSRGRQQLEITPESAHQREGAREGKKSAVVNSQHPPLVSSIMMQIIANN